MWTGLMQKQCVNIELGYVYSFANFTTMCTTSEDCLGEYSLGNVNFGSSYVCAKTNINPFNGVASFDDIPHALISLFIIITMEGWTDFYSFVQKTFKDDYYINNIISFLYFHMFIFMGGYYLMNLFLAVVWSKFSEISRSNRVIKYSKGNLCTAILEEGNNTSDKDKDKKLSEEAKIEKFRDKFPFIEKDPSKIPIAYKTLNDLTLMESLSAKELFYLKEKISTEAVRAESDFEKDCEKLRQDSQMPNKGSLTQLLERSDSLLDNDSKKSSPVVNRKRTLYMIQKLKSIRIYHTCIDDAIKESQAQWDLELDNSEKPKPPPERKRTIKWSKTKTIQSMMRNTLKNGLMQSPLSPGRRSSPVNMMRKREQLDTSGITQDLYEDQLRKMVDEDLQIAENLNDDSQESNNMIEYLETKDK